MVCTRDVEKELNRELDPIEKAYLDLVAEVRKEEQGAGFRKESGSWKGLSQGAHKVSGSQKRLKSMWRKESGTWHRYWSEWPMDLIGWYDGDIVATAPEYTLCDGTGGTPDLIDSFPRGAAAHAAQSGSDTHTPTSVSKTTNSFELTHASGDSGSTTYTRGDVGHTHTIAAHTHAEADHKPPYLALQPVVINGKCRSGLTLWYRGNVAPTGWSLRADANGRYFRGKTGTGTATGGSETHSHSHSGNTGSSSATTTSSAHPFSSTDGSPPHTHTANHTAVGDSNPSHVELSAIEADSDDAEVFPNMVGMLKGTRIPNGWGLCDGLGGRPDYINVMIKVNNGAFSDTHQGSDSHTDESASFYTGYGGQGVKTPEDESPWRPTGWYYQNHRHLVGAHSHGAANDNLPVHTPILLIVKL